jgi:hypothetical protein
MNSVTPCEACGHELRFQPDWSGRVLYCPGCRGRLRVPRAPARFPLRSRRLGLALLLVIAVSLPAVFGAATMRWSAALPSIPQEPGLPYPPGQFGPIPSSRGMRGPADLFAMLPPVQVDPHLAIPTGVDSRLEIPADAISDEGIRFVGRLPASLAFASDPSRGLLLSAGADGTLHWCDAETLRPVGSCRLPGPAYQLACDGKRRRLYAALSSPDEVQLGPLGDCVNAAGDIHVFDLDRLLALAPTALARASKVIGCKADIWSMHLSPDRESLFYMAETPHSLRIVCVDALDRRGPKTLEMRAGGAHTLASTPDGKTLFGLAGGRLFAVDVAGWSLRWSLVVVGNVLSLAVGPGDQLYLVERRLSHFLLVVDPATRRVVSRCALGVEGRPYLCRSVDGRRVYFSNSAVTSGRILALDAADDPRRPHLTGWAQSDCAHLVRGGIRLSDDGRFLLTGVGQLFRVGS